MIDLGIVKPGQLVIIPFQTFSSAGASVTITGLAATDIEVFKDGGTTQRASDNGYTLLDTDGIDFDGITGIHGVSIDLADNSTAGFWAAGSWYMVVIASITVDSQTVNFIPVTFRIGQPAAVLNTTIATLAGQTSFTLTAGPAEDDALNGMWLMFHDVASAVQQAAGLVLDYTGSTKTVTLAAAPTFTIAATDNVSVMGPAPLQPATTGNKLDVHTDGDAEANVTKWTGTAVGAPDTAGYPKVTIKDGTGAGEIALTAGAVDNVTLTVTTTTLTNAPGDSAGVGTLLTRLSATRAGYLDNLSAGAVALEASVQTAITNIAAVAAAAATAVWAAGTRTLTSFGFSVTVGTNSDKTGYALTAAYDPAKTAAQAGDAMTLTTAAVDLILDDAMEGSLTFRQMMRILISFAAGKAAGATGGATTLTYRDQADTKARLTQVVDASGNRTSTTVDGS